MGEVFLSIEQYSSCGALGILLQIVPSPQKNLCGEEGLLLRWRPWLLSPNIAPPYRPPHGRVWALACCAHRS